LAQTKKENPLERPGTTTLTGEGGPKTTPKKGTAPHAKRPTEQKFLPHREEGP